jgi:prepilin-type N-terminal cleavage/methylation domain-containing protein
MKRLVQQAGFTLVEVLLSMTILSMLAGMSLPVYISFQQRTDMDVAVQQIVGALRRAQTYARGSNGDNGWGVEIQSSTLTLFRGTVFASRNAAYDEVVSIPTAITTGGLTDITFAKFVATPSTTGSITLSTDSINSRTVTINAEGMVNF